MSLGQYGINLERNFGVEKASPPSPFFFVSLMLTCAGVMVLVFRPSRRIFLVADVAARRLPKKATPHLFLFQSK